jgi:hypothetical protein
MSGRRYRKSLKKFAQIIEKLDLSKKIAAAKWLEGVITSQILTNEERESIVKAANEYIEGVEEGDYLNAVNELIGFLEREQRSAKRALKREKKKHLAESRVSTEESVAVDVRT